MDSQSQRSVPEFGRCILHDEAQALDALADSLGDEFTRAIDPILNSTAP
ncbi:MAG: hypothetical protein H0X53_07150 [Sphingomonas sp.]|nr:hypothetical protein [Sphingomonas sp.]